MDGTKGCLENQKDTEKDGHNHTKEDYCYSCTFSSNWLCD